MNDVLNLGKGENNIIGRTGAEAGIKAIADNFDVRRRALQPNQI